MYWSDPLESVDPQRCYRYLQIVTSLKLAKADTYTEGIVRSTLRSSTVQEV